MSFTLCYPSASPSAGAECAPGCSSRSSDGASCRTGATDADEADPGGLALDKGRRPWRREAGFATHEL
jgi:hypothetical protein